MSTRCPNSCSRFIFEIFLFLLVFVHIHVVVANVDVILMSALVQDYKLTGSCLTSSSDRLRTEGTYGVISVGHRSIRDSMVFCELEHQIESSLLTMRAASTESTASVSKECSRITSTILPDPTNAPMMDTILCSLAKAATKLIQAFPTSPPCFSPCCKVPCSWASKIFGVVAIRAARASIDRLRMELFRVVERTCTRFCWDEV